MKKTNPSTPISSFKHQDKRVNIPPQELSAFLEDEEKAPQTMLYPRDPSLDPQLVWKGKDEQDKESLAVPTVPIYIQEKIQPQAIVENVRAEAARAKPGRVGEPTASYNQMDFFGDFNHIEFQELVEFYQHEQNWSNRMVLGDSLLVMNSLAEKEGLKGKVQMIYLDPPYGIKFGSNWQSHLRKREVKDGAEVDLSREPEVVKAFRDTWELGIHSYLSYLRDRFTVARELLTESGSIFVQIGDENVHLVRSILDEVFGSENFVRLIFFRTTSGLGQSLIDKCGDYLVWYSKNIENVKYRNLFQQKGMYFVYPAGYDYIVDEKKNIDSISDFLKTSGSNKDDYLKVNDLFTLSDLKSQSGNGGIILINNKKYETKSGSFKTNQEGIDRINKSSRISITGNTPRYIRYYSDFPYVKFDNMWSDQLSEQNKSYVVQTNVEVITRCILMTTDPGDLVLDPTCGSGTTAFVAEQWGRRWITIDTSRVSIALARMRLMTAKYPYYLLADSAEGARKEAELTKTAEFPEEPRQAHFTGDLRQGFVYQRVPHITLKSIANNEEIDVIYAKWQEQMEPLRAEINKQAGRQWEEWELPRPETGEIASGAAHPRNDMLQKWWEMRRKRQSEMDASIAKRADVELLYDKPYEDGKRIRVCGPFTVESLSPHRVLSAEAERPKSEEEGARASGGGKFEQMIIENLRAAGVQNTKKGERLHFTRLEPFAGQGYLQASGEYLEQGRSKRAALCIGPEHGTVGAELIREAAKEAMQGVGFDLLVVLGFAFDPSISEEVKKYGRLMVLPARINPDLMMGDLLKKTKNANLFTVFGEPDIRIKEQDGKLVVSLLGVDIFDPTTGEIRSSSTDDIACWFVDSEYNGESFFARQAYFTGWDEPYEKLRRALRAEVDEAAWEMLYRTESIPFEKPKTGKFAVKVINDYGDEVLKVYTV